MIQILQIRRYPRLKGGEIVSFLPGTAADYKFKRQSKKHKTGFITVLKRFFWR